MIASILQCEYVKHGMTCELGGSIVGFFLLWGAVSAVLTLVIVLVALGRRR